MSTTTRSQKRGRQRVTRQGAKQLDERKESRTAKQQQERVAFTQQKRSQVEMLARQKPKAAVALSDSSSSDSGSGGESDVSPSSSGESSHSSPAPLADLSPSGLALYTHRPSPVAIPSNSIHLTYLHSFLSPSECTQLIELSAGCFSRSLVGLKRGEGRESPNRTSHSAALSSSHPVVKDVRRRVAELTGARNAQIEQLAVVRYEPGQQFNPHYDSSGDDTPRSHTIFAYLNDVPEGGGGETEFTRLGVKFKPKLGDALCWENRADRESYHLDGEHAGRPPLVGIKYGLNIWINFDDVNGNE